MSIPDAQGEGYHTPSALLAHLEGVARLSISLRTSFVEANLAFQQSLAGNDEGPLQSFGKLIFDRGAQTMIGRFHFHEPAEYRNCKNPKRAQLCGGRFPQQGAQEADLKRLGPLPAMSDILLRPFSEKAVEVRRGKEA